MFKPIDGSTILTVLSPGALENIREAKSTLNTRVYALLAVVALDLRLILYLITGHFFCVTCQTHDLLPLETEPTAAKSYIFKTESSYLQLTVDYRQLGSWVLYL